MDDTQRDRRLANIERRINADHGRDGKPRDTVERWLFLELKRTEAELDTAYRRGLADGVKMAKEHVEIDRGRGYIPSADLVWTYVDAALEEATR